MSKIILSEESAVKIKKEILKLDISIKATKDNKFKVIMTKEVKDRDGEIVKIDGINTEWFLKNPVLLDSHSYRGIDNIIGKFTKIYKSKENGVAVLIGEGIFAIDNPKGQLAKDLYTEGFLKTVSIGFMVFDRNEEDKRIIETSELLECSFVPVPSNREALDSMKSKGIDVEKMKDFGFIDKKEEFKDIKEELKDIKNILESLIAEKKVEEEKENILKQKKLIQSMVNGISGGLKDIKAFK